MSQQSTDLPTVDSQFNILKNPYVDNFTSVSGSDIVGVFGHIEFLNLQGVSISVNREVHPIYVMGRTDPISFVRGKRGVAGSLVTVATDRGALYDINEKYGVHARPVGDTVAAGRRTATGTDDFLSANVLGSERERLGFDLARPTYYDQLPPFDITLVGRTDTLGATISRIGGVFIVSMGTGISVDDNSIEQQMTFVALFYEDWRPAGRRNWQQYDAPSGDYNAFNQENQGVDPVEPSELEDEIGDQFGLDPIERGSEDFNGGSRSLP